MAYEKLVRLAERLLKRTEDGEVTWEETVDDAAFQTAFPGYVVKLLSREDPADDRFERIILRIYDSESTLIEEIDSDDLSSFYGGQRPQANMLEDLYSKARRVAKGVEKALDTILEALGDEPVQEEEDSGTYGPPGSDDIPF
jgi:hypothetical protein